MRKSAKKDCFLPKKCRFEKMPPIFSAHFWFLKTGKSPLFLATNLKNVRTRPKNFSKSGQKPGFIFKKWAKFFPISKRVRTILLTSRLDQSSCPPRLSDPRFEIRQSHKYKTMYAEACEIFRLPDQCFSLLDKQSDRNSLQHFFLGLAHSKPVLLSLRHFSRSTPYSLSK